MNIKDLIEAVKFQVSVKPQDEFMREVAEGLETLYEENNRQKAEIDKLTCDYGCYKVSATDVVEQLKEEIEALIAGQKTLQKALAEKEAEVEKCLNIICKKEDMEQQLAKERQQYYDELQITNSEIERLKKANDNKRNQINGLTKLLKRADEIKSEAVKEFSERLKSEIVNKPSMFKAIKATVDFLNGLTHRQHEILDDIDNLVKEMVGEQK